MTRTTLEMWETQEVEVTKTGHKWEETYTEPKTVKVEKEGLVCDCCPRTIGPVDDPGPHATLMANPTVHGTERFDDDVVIDGERIKRELENKFHNGLRSRSTEINSYSAHNSNQTIRHRGWDGSVKYTKDSPGGGTALFARRKDLRILLEETLDEVMPHAFDGSTKSFKTDAELHFCESCAEEFGLEVTDGIEETVEERESEDEDEDTESTTVRLGKNGVERIITGLMICIAAYSFSYVALGIPIVEAYATMLNSPGFVTEVLFTGSGTSGALAIIVTFCLLGVMMLPVFGILNLTFGLLMVMVCLIRMWNEDD